MKLNLGCGNHPLDGFENLDAKTGWYFEGGIDYPDGSVEAITVSHALMYVDVRDWPFVFSEMARVLEPGGVIRITEDSTADPSSERFGGHTDAVTLTTASLVMEHMMLADLGVSRVPPDFTRFRDESLIQQWHGAPPKVFHVEGVKPG